MGPMISLSRRAGRSAEDLWRDFMPATVQARPGSRYLWPQVSVITEPPLPPRRLPARTRVAAGVGGAVSGLSRRLGRGGGSVIGGRALLAVDGRALEHLAAGRSLALV